MCGISAIIRKESGDLSFIVPMTRTIAHRGPDDEGFQKFENKVALGHRRLSILDLSSAGHQPMKTPSGRFWITYNGEVYNYRDIRAELQKSGRTFQTQTDTEVILAAYELWGTDCLRRFNGMFSFVIYDTVERKIFAARDRFGVKPLYYADIDGIFALASEIKQFTVLPEWKFQANGQRAYDFLNWGVLDHTDETLFSGVKQLRGGHYLHFSIDSLKESTPKPIQWYFLSAEKFNGSFEEASLQYRDLLMDSIRLRLHADVDVGSCLSGGLDSSTIVCMAAECLKDSKEQLITFTAGSEVSRFDEREYVDAVIQKTGVDSRVVIPRSDELFNSLSDLIWHQDEPFISTSVFAQWEIFKLVKENGIKVMLDGQGADEHLGGYHGFFGNHLYDLFTSLRWKSLIQEASATRNRHPHLPLMMMLANKLVPSTLQQRLRGMLGKSSAIPGWIDFERLQASPSTPYPAQHPFYAQSQQQILESSVPMLLHFEDRNSMAHSIESRTPFLDYRLVEFALGCPSHYKVGGGVSKRLLRSAADGILPDKITHRHDKMGFMTAEEVWFKSQHPSQVLEGVQKAIDLSRGALSDALYSRTQEMLEGRRPFDYSYWRALCYGAWMEKFEGVGMERSGIEPLTSTMPLLRSTN